MKDEYISLEEFLNFYELFFQCSRSVQDDVYKILRGEYTIKELNKKYGLGLKESENK